MTRMLPHHVEGKTHRMHRRPENVEIQIFHRQEEATEMTEPQKDGAAELLKDSKKKEKAQGNEENRLGGDLEVDHDPGKTAGDIEEIPEGAQIIHHPEI